MSTKMFSSNLKNLQSIPKQRFNLRAYDRPYKVSYEEIDDTSTLGKNEKEIDFDQRMADANQREFELWTAYISRMNYSEDSTFFPYPYPEPPIVLLATRFSALKKIWQNETMYSSSLTEKNDHWAYQQIIGMGWTILPLILKELETNPDYWFFALSKITGINPVPSESRGKLHEMASAWLQWAKNNDIPR